MRYAMIVLCALPLFAGDPKPVAIVAASNGNISVRSASSGKQPVHLFDWLTEGSAIELEPGAKLTLAFANGSRMELSDAAHATIGPVGITMTSGKKRDLGALPALPNIAAVSASGATRPAAFRVRGAKVTGLYPNAGSASIAAETTLRFDAVPQAKRYRVEIEDEAGATILGLETETPSVVVPPGVLAAGQHYYWRVRTLDSAVSARGESDFTTLTADRAQARNELRHAASDASSLVVLADVDRRLGLLYEATAELRQAGEKMPDAALQPVIADLESKMRE